MYQPKEAEDGHRVLVDRLWPRGFSAASADWEVWERDVAPSPELRRWYGHQVERFDAFRDRYRRELGAGAALAARERLLRQAREGALTLLTATRDVEHSAAQVLAELLSQSLS